MTDVVEASRTKSPLFAQVFSGPLKEFTTLIFCTSSLCDVLSFEYLKKTIGKYEPTVAAERLEHFLSQLSGHLPFAAFIIGVQSKTEEELAQASAVSNAPRRASTGPSLQERLAPVVRGAHNVVIALKKGIRTILTVGAHGLIATLKISGKGVVTMRVPLARALNTTWGLIGAPRILVPILIMLIVGGGTWYGVARYRATQTAMHQKLTAQISELGSTYAQAESLLAANNESGARNKLKNAQLLLQALPVKLPADLAPQRESIINAIAEATQKLQHMLTPANPTLIAFPSASLKTSQWVLTTATNLVLIAQGQIAIVPRKDLKPEGVKTFTLPQEDGAITQVLATDHASVLLITSKNVLKEFDIKKTSFTTLTLPQKGIRSITSAALYNKKLYILDAAGGQIWKLVPIEGGFAEAKAWLTGETGKALLQGVSLLTLDGSVFTSTPQGLVQQFDAGKPGTFKASIDPQPAGVARLATSPSSKYVYLLDAPSKRLIVLSKETGMPVTQYTSPIWNGLRDVGVNEKTKTITLLTNLGVVEFIASHLK